MKNEKGTSYIEFLFVLIIVVIPISYAVFELIGSLKVIRSLIRGVLLYPFP